MDKLFKNFNDVGLKCDWFTVLVGIKYKFINVQDVHNYVERFLLDNDDENASVELLFLDNIYDIYEFVKNIIQKNNKNILGNEVLWNREKDRWIYCMLYNLRNKEKNIDLLMEKVAEIYDAFDCPQYMDQFVYYMPVKDDYVPLEHSVEENQERLLNFFDQYLSEYILKLK